MLTTESNTSEAFNANSIVFSHLCASDLELNRSHLKESPRETSPKDRRQLEMFPPSQLCIKKKKKKKETKNMMQLPKALH